MHDTLQAPMLTQLSANAGTSCSTTCCITRLLIYPHFCTQKSCKAHHVPPTLRTYTMYPVLSRGNMIYTLRCLTLSMYPLVPIHCSALILYPLHCLALIMCPLIPPTLLNTNHVPPTLHCINHVPPLHVDTVIMYTAR